MGKKLRSKKMSSCTGNKMEQVKIKTSKDGKAIDAKNKGKPEVDFLDMVIDESEMTFPIKSEENVQKERKMTINGAIFYEKRKAVEICDRSDTKFLFIGVHRNIGDKTYKTTELFKNGDITGSPLIWARMRLRKKKKLYQLILKR